MQICCLKDSKLSEAYLIIAIAKEAGNEVETVHYFRQLGITNQDKSQNERPWEPLGTIGNHWEPLILVMQLFRIHMNSRFLWLIMTHLHIDSCCVISIDQYDFNMDIWLRWLQYEFR